MIDRCCHHQCQTRPSRRHFEALGCCPFVRHKWQASANLMQCALVSIIVSCQARPSRRHSGPVCTWGSLWWCLASTFVVRFFLWHQSVLQEQDPSFDFRFADITLYKLDCRATVLDYCAFQGFFSRVLFHWHQVLVHGVCSFLCLPQV